MEKLQAAGGISQPALKQPRLALEKQKAPIQSVETLSAAELMDIDKVQLHCVHLCLYGQWMLHAQWAGAKRESSFIPQGTRRPLIDQFDDNGYLST